jgi:type III secretion apparatus needle protein
VAALSLRLILNLVFLLIKRETIMSSIDTNAAISQANTYNQNVQNEMNTLDPSDPEAMLQMQQDMANYQNYISTISAMISDFKQMCSGIAQKM